MSTINTQRQRILRKNSSLKTTLLVRVKQNGGLYGIKSRQIKRQNIRNTDYSALHPVWGEARILKLDSKQQTGRERQTKRDREGERAASKLRGMSHPEISPP